MDNLQQMEEVGLGSNLNKARAVQKIQNFFHIIQAKKIKNTFITNESTVAT